MEALISDPNRSIATLAITTLLKTGTESSVDRLMKQISSFAEKAEGDRGCCCFFVSSIIVCRRW